MTTTLLKNKMAFGVETEATEGTAETIATADVLQVEAPSITINRNPQENQGSRTTRGANAVIPGGKTADVSFGIRERGSGTAGTSPASPVVDAHLAAGFSSTNYTARHNFDLADTDNACTCQLFEGRVVGSVGKSRIARGVKLNLTTSFEPGQNPLDQFEGNGIYSSDADATVLAKGGDETTQHVALVSATQSLAEIQSISVFDNDGVAEVMLDLAASNLKYSVSFTPAASCTVVGYAVLMEKTGTPANETNGFSIQVETDAAGDPSDTPVANTAVTRSVTLIEAAEQWEFFMLARGSRGSLTGSTAYHVVLEGDWDVDASNTIKLSTNAVAAGAQQCKYYDASWAALALKNVCVVILTMPPGGDDIYFGPTELNLNNEITVTPDDPNDTQGHHYADLVNADPVLTITPRDALDSEVDMAAWFDDQTELFWQCTVGTVSGNRVEHTMMRLTPIDVSDEDRDSKVVKSLPLRLDRELDGAIYTKRYK